MLDAFLRSRENGVFYPGHASALVRLGGFLILLDPVWDFSPYGDYWAFVPPQYNCDKAMKLIDATIVSHIHEDHLCEPVLEKLEEHDVITIMDRRPRLSWRLGNLRSVNQLRPYDWHLLIPNGNHSVEVYFIPHHSNGVDSSCFIRDRQSGYTVYHGNDNFLSAETIEKIQGDIERVDVAMVPYSFVHWYPQCMEMPEAEKAREQDRLNTQSLADAYNFVEGFKPTVTIPFGNSLFYDDGPTHPLNKELATPFQFNGATPLFAGDYVLGHKIFRVLNDEPEYREMQQHFLTRRQPPMELFSSPIDGLPLVSVQARVSRARFIVPNHVLVVNHVAIDMERRLIGIVRGDLKDLGRPYTKFTLSHEIFRRWVSGEIIFEHALGTRRFTCSREPNCYNGQVFRWMNEYL